MYLNVPEKNIRISKWIIDNWVSAVSGEKTLVFFVNKKLIYLELPEQFRFNIVYIVCMYIYKYIYIYKKEMKKKKFIVI